MIALHPGGFAQHTVIHRRIAIGIGYRTWLDSLLTRRAFVELVSKATLAVALGGLMRFLDQKREFIRPPGALPEDKFLSLCIRCDKCREVCPWGLVTPVLLTENVIHVGTPRLVETRRYPGGSYCPLCWKCIPVCPTGALDRVRGRF